MKVLSSSTHGEWLSKTTSVESHKTDAAEQEAQRALSDLFRCTNLVVLAGLGTSLCVKEQATGTPLAPTMWQLWSCVKETYELFGDWDNMMKIVHHPEGDINIESLLSRCKLAESFFEGDDLKAITNFIEMAESQIYDAVNFIKTGQQLPAHIEFLRRVARRSNRKSRAKVFTTNYDKCFEEAGRQGRYVVIDGFSQTQPPTFDAVYFSYDVVRRDRDSDTSDFIPNLFHLYKLHGSIDWEREDISGEIHKTSAPKNPLLIYPRSSKYELAFAQPYIEMMSALQAALREPNTGLLIVGFGFNDNHLSEPILSAIRSNLALKTVVVSPRIGPWEDSKGEAQPGEAVNNLHIQKLKGLAVSGDARISLLHCGFEEIIPFIPDIVAETDLEKHLERIRKLEAK